ncbi:lanthionine synthetase C family protein [Kribbella sp. NPDC026611]|uniref:lanthionine synthetase C family protein n=1 Tax=Kribbella sp. NPDC026611 TaxID=3154911 RepID=UPI0033FAEB87
MSVVAERIAVRVADPTILAAAITATARQSQYADLLPWRPASLAQGHAGIALLCAEFDRRDPNQGWDRRGHQHLAAAVAVADPHDLSLFSGLAGIGFAAVRLAAGRPRYARLLKTVDATLQPYVEDAAARLAGADGCAASDHDLVSGLTGVGVYLLSRPTQQDALTRALSGLARLLAGVGHPRRWHTPVELAAGSLRTAYPSGHHNCGLAHGAPGPLALLSLALLDGVEVPESRQAVESTADWLVDHQTTVAGTPDWPDAVSLDGTSPAGVAGRAAWCYGAVGVSRSLWLAGTALRRADWRDLAADTIRGIARRPPEQWWLDTPTFCHGRAGLLQVLRRFAADLGDVEVARTASELGAGLEAGFDPDSLLGVRGREPGGVLVDHPGLLDGAPGIALALLESPGWDRMFLLS